MRRRPQVFLAVVLALGAASQAVGADMAEGVPVGELSSSPANGILVEQLLLAERIGRLALAYAAAEAPQTNELVASAEAFENNKAALKDGDPGRHVGPIPVVALAEMSLVERRGLRLRHNIQKIQKTHANIVALADAVKRAEKGIDGMLPKLDQLAMGVATKGIHDQSEQVYVATRQLMLVQRMARNLQAISSRQDNEVMLAALDRLGRDASLFGRVLAGQIAGNSSMGILKLSDPKLRADAAELDRLHGPFSEAVMQILENAPEVFENRAAVEDVVKTTAELTPALRQLGTAMNRHYVRSH